MARVKIRVNGVFLDTFKEIDDMFYITEQAYDLKNLEQRKADYSRMIKIPRSNSNAGVLGLLSNEIDPNNTFTFVLLFDDITFWYGQLLLTEYNEFEIQIILFSGNFELFDLLPNKQVRDLDLSAYSFAWTQAALGATKTNTSGCTSIKTNFIDWDSLDPGDGAISQGSIYRDMKAFGFGFYYKTLVEEIVKQAGYTLTYHADLLADDYLNDLLVCCPVILPGSTEDIVSGTVHRTTNYVYDASILLGVPDRIPFSILSDPGGMWDAPNDEWVVPTTGDWVVIFDYVISNTNGADLGPCEIEILNNASNIITKEYYQETNLAQRVTVAFQANAGDLIYIECTAESRNASRYDIVTINTGALFYLQEDTPDPTGTLYPQDWLPEMNQRDALLGFLKIFNGIITSNPFSKTTEIKTWDSYIAETAQDLTDNVVAGQNVANQISIGTYYRESLLTYSNDSEVHREDTNETESFNDPTLQQRGTILNQFFSASDDDGSNMNIEAAGWAYTSASNYNAAIGVNVFTFGQVEVFKPGDYIYYKDALSINDRIDRIRFAASGLGGQVYDNYTVGLVNVDVYIIRIETNNISPRIGIIKRSQSIGVQQQTTLNGYMGVNSLVNIDVNVVVFTGLGWNTLTEMYYRNMFDALKTPKILQVWMKFNTAEFYNIDISKPVYIRLFNGRFHINKIDQFKLNQPCRVELIRINQLI